MLRLKLLKILESKLYFTVEDISTILNIKRESAWVLCNRYVKNGMFLRIKNNFYILNSSVKSNELKYFLRLSNFIQVPSYVSFSTALSYYEYTTQVQQNYFEAVSIKRSIKYCADQIEFEYHKIKKEFYFGFIKTGDIFIATPEKALIDSIYFVTMGRYSLDFNAIDFDKFNKREIKKILKKFSIQVKSNLEKWMTL